MTDLAALLLAEVERLAAAASPGPWRFDYMSGRPWRVRGPVAKDIATFAWRENDGDQANAKLTAAFGSPDRATAIMSVLILNAKTPCLLNECGQCAQCISRAVIRDLAASLGVEE